MYKNKPISFLSIIIERPDVSNVLKIKDKNKFGYNIPLPTKLTKSDLKNLQIYAIFENGYFDEIKLKTD